MSDKSWAVKASKGTAICVVCWLSTIVGIIVIARQAGLSYDTIAWIYGVAAILLWYKYGDYKQRPGSRQTMFGICCWCCNCCKGSQVGHEHMLGDSDAWEEKSRSGRVMPLSRAGESIVTKGMSSQPDGTPGTISAGPCTGGPRRGCCAVRLDGGEDLIINRKKLKTRVLV